jgi:hypothetical protein
MMLETVPVELNALELGFLVAVIRGWQHEKDDHEGFPMTLLEKLVAAAFELGA